MAAEFPALSRREVLYVDDHDVNLQLMQTLFNRRPDLRLLTAIDEAETMQIVPQISPRLLLLDINLGEIRGTELLQKLRKRPGLEIIPAIAITAERDFDLRGTGFCELWRKPLVLFHTLYRLDHWLPPLAAPSAPVCATNQVRPAPTRP